MKKINIILAILIITAIACLLSSCKSKTVYVPVESVKTEYIDRYQRDSIRLYDSIFVEKYLKGDTVFLTKEKYKYLYRDKLKTDTINKYDVSMIPFPVVTEKEKTVYPKWLIILALLGAVGIGFIGYKIYSFF